MGVCAVVALAVLVACAVLTHAQAAVWRSEVTLWAHAVQQAPRKPRPALNYGAALLIDGQAVKGIWYLRYADRLSRQAHIPAMDASDTQAKAAENLSALLAVMR